MKRRDFIRNIAISSGLFLLPGTLFSFAKKQKFHLVIIGDSNLRYVEQFCKLNSITSCKAIGCRNEQLDNFGITINKNIEFDFSSVTVNHDEPLKNKLLLPQNIADVFKPNNKYLIISSLYRQNAILTYSIINLLDNKAIGFWFFGTIPLLNPRIAPWATNLFSKFEGNPRVKIYDINVFGDKLRHESVAMLFTDALVESDDRLVGELGGFCGEIVV